MPFVPTATCLALSSAGWLTPTSSQCCSKSGCWPWPIYPFTLQGPHVPLGDTCDPIS